MLLFSAILCSRADHLDFHTGPELWGKSVRVQCCFFPSTETILSTVRDGEPRTTTSTFTQLLSSDGLTLSVDALYIYISISISICILFYSYFSFTIAMTRFIYILFTATFSLRLRFHCVEPYDRSALHTALRSVLVRWPALFCQFNSAALLPQQVKVPVWVHSCTLKVPVCVCVCLSDFNRYISSYRVTNCQPICLSTLTPKVIKALLNTRALFRRLWDFNPRSYCITQIGSFR